MGPYLLCNLSTLEDWSCAFDNTSVSNSLESVTLLLPLVNFTPSHGYRELRVLNTLLLIIGYPLVL